MHGDLSQRTIQSEWLDELPATDPRAIRSRRDLRRVNAWMGNAAIVSECLKQSWRGPAPTRLIELGAGDGTFLLSVARRCAANWPNVEVCLIDRQKLLSQETADSVATLGWSVTAIEADVFDWLKSDTDKVADITVANLFLHHFPSDQLHYLFALVAERTRLLVACEPSRTRLALAGLRLLPLIGCNDVTRHDALISVRAGFVGDELSALWPDGEEWELQEGSADFKVPLGTGLFSHVFAARRLQPALAEAHRQTSAKPCNKSDSRESDLSSARAEHETE